MVVDSKVKERLMELEIEREEKQKTIELLKEIREKELQEHMSKIDKIKEEGTKTAEELKIQMTE